MELCQTHLVVKVQSQHVNSIILNRMDIYYTKIIIIIIIIINKILTLKKKAPATDLETF